MIIAIVVNIIIIITIVIAAIVTGIIVIVSAIGVVIVAITSRCSSSRALAGWGTRGYVVGQAAHRAGNAPRIGIRLHAIAVVHRLCAEWKNKVA